MDKIWYRNPSKSEVIGRCGGDGKNEWPHRTDKKLNAKNKFLKTIWSAIIRINTEDRSFIITNVTE